MNKQLWQIVGLLFTLHPFNGLASDTRVNSLLKKQYLSKFIDKTRKHPDEKYIAPSEFDELRRYSLSDRMTPLRTRSLLLHYLCPECAGKTNPQNSPPVNIHSDAWHDFQVFQVEGKAHVYDTAFPGMSLMGEVYGAYLLAAGATQNPGTLKSRQNLIRAIQISGQADQLQTVINQLNRILPSGLSIFDRKHPFNTFATGQLFMDENIIGTLANTTTPEIISPSDLEALLQNLTRTRDNFVNMNLNGQYARSIVYVPLLMIVISATSQIVNFQLIKNARTLNLLPWQGVKNYLANSVILPSKLGGLSPLLLITVDFLVQAQQTYQLHWASKNAMEVLSYELTAIKPFIELLFSFNDIQGLPLIDFSLSLNESTLVYHLQKQMSELNSNNINHFYYNQFPKVTSTLRMLLLLRETIARYLVNIAQLDFYLAVAEGTKNPDLWCFAEYHQNNKQPKLTALQLWNPIIPADKAVPSDIKLGGKNPASIILTGANASGKSTFLRALGINSIFMAQTLGVAASKRFTLSPFTDLVSLMEKRDSKGRSSYETEVDAIVQAWAISSNLPQSHRNLILADELFRTTNPGEGASASRLLAQKLGSLSQVSLLVSTHFKEMTGLATEYPSLFANKHMSIEIDDNRQITKMNYRLTNGPTPSANAIQLFEQNFRKTYPELFPE